MTPPPKSSLLVRVVARTVLFLAKPRDYAWTASLLSRAVFYWALAWFSSMVFTNRDIPLNLYLAFWLVIVWTTVYVITS